MAVVCRFSKTGKGEIEEIQALEKELGVTLLAISCPEMKIAPELSEEQLKKIQELEKKLSVILMAIQ